MSSFRDDLDEAVLELNEHYGELRQAARERLGDLFDSSDYPTTLVGMFAIEHDFPSVEPPPYLRQLSPELYQHECQRVQSRFDEAVQLAEQASSRNSLDWWITSPRDSAVQRTVSRKCFAIRRSPIWPSSSSGFEV